MANGMRPFRRGNIFSRLHEAMRYYAPAMDIDHVEVDHGFPYLFFEVKEVPDAWESEGVDSNAAGRLIARSLWQMEVLCSCVRDFRYQSAYLVFITRNGKWLWVLPWWQLVERIEKAIEEVPALRGLWPSRWEQKHKPLLLPKEDEAICWIPSERFFSADEGGIIRARQSAIANRAETTKKDLLKVAERQEDLSAIRTALNSMQIFLEGEIMDRVIRRLQEKGIR